MCVRVSRLYAYIKFKCPLGPAFEILCTRAVLVFRVYGRIIDVFFLLSMVLAAVHVFFEKISLPEKNPAATINIRTTNRHLCYRVRNTRTLHEDLFDTCTNFPKKNFLFSLILPHYHICCRSSFYKQRVVFLCFTIRTSTSTCKANKHPIFYESILTRL